MNEYANPAHQTQVVQLCQNDACAKPLYGERVYLLVRDYPHDWVGRQAVFCPECAAIITSSKKE